MKTLIIYLCDMHFQAKDISTFETKANKIVASLNSREKFDDLLIFIGGDIANQGKSNEYSIAAKFIGKLVGNIKEQFKLKARVFLVPGNHDLNFKGKTRTRKEAIELIKNYGANIKPEKELFTDFLWLASEVNHCFNEEEIEFDTKIINTCNVNLQINLLNSALFSLLDKNDSDEGIHFLSESAIKSLKKHDNSDYVFTIMHHSPEYFSPSCKGQLVSAIENNTNVLFVGHEHIRYASEKTSGLNSTSIIRGGRFSDSTQIDSEFFLLECDWIKQDCNVTSMRWDSNANIYEANLQQVCSLSKRLFGTDIFEKWFYSGSESLPTVGFEEYFEFSQLSVKLDNDKFATKDIVTFEDFKKECEGKHIIEIASGDFGGKTTLLKYLNKVMEGGKIPLIIRCEDMDNKRLDKVIQLAFEFQYSSNRAEYEKFKQMSKNKKIVFIDDLHLLRNIEKDHFIQYLLNDFNIIVYTIAETKEFNLKKDMLEYIEDQCLDVLRLKIQPFYKEKRKPLLFKICQCLEPKKTEKEISNTVETVEKFIGDQLKHFSLHPEFLIMFARSYVFNLSDKGSSNPLRSVFDSNISISIKEFCGKTNVDDNIQILQRLAYFVHFSKQYKVDQSEFNKIVEEYNLNQRTKHSPLDVLQALINAKILKVDETKIAFVNKSYLAYFVAKRLNRLINDGQGEDDLKFIVENLFYNINADILLFFTYITENTKALGVIIQQEYDFVKGIPEFSISDKVFESFLCCGNTDEKLSLPSKSDRKEHIKKVSATERRIVESESDKLKTIDIYDDEDMDEFISIQKKLIKYLEIISKMLPSFQHLLTSDQQDLIVKEIYTLPNKLIYFMLEPFINDMDKIAAEIENMSRDKDIRGFRNRDEIKSTIAKLFQSWILAIWDMTAIWTVDKRSINALDLKEDLNKNINYKLQNIMMYENLRELEPYIKKSNALFDEPKTNFLIKQLLRLIFRKHCLTFDLPYFGKTQSYIDKYGLDNKRLLGMRGNFTKKG